ncbi:carboxylesterase/lipase family protein [Microbacterium sp. No. 7]|uniref:carboxylesterase/lipase family protein n=1 Tax=Microbacterium sp. No. 7 TaxID=1714373 RepID=UPI0006CFE272|nr:carboxylesterase family protein [Microbacterium sp. No. 7]ALJ19225.1 carboxylesterase [Microbacterium sp. No. 7]
MRSDDVRISTGLLRGTRGDGVRRFLGIPYARPPFGERRFALPEPAPAWQGERDATAFGATPPQRPYEGPLGELLPSVTIAGDDILTVNVWAPEDAADAPVVVWIHGGAFERGAAALGGYDGTSFARDGVVFVSIGYRLGVEGFAVLDGAPANLGLADAALAVEWVHREIAAFGGDPGRITLMGESAGGSLVAALLSRPATRALVRGGIVQSGPLEAFTRERAARPTLAIAKRLGIPATRDAFAAVPPDELVRVRGDIARGSSPLGGVPGFGLTADGEVLPVSPHTALAGVDLPLLIGTNTDEYRLWLTPAELAAIGPVKAWLAQRAMKVPRAAATAARAALPGASPGERLGQIVTDRLLRAPASAVARARSAPTYVYEFAWPSPVRDLRAAHAVEIAFVFDGLETAGAVALSGTTAPAALASEMHGAWVRFVRTGDPGWERYDQRRLTRVLDVSSRTEPQRRASLLDSLAASHP